MSGKKTAIITGASGGIGAGLVEEFLREGYNVVATSREANRKLTTSGSLVLLEGDIGKQQTAAYAVEAAINNFGTIDVLVNNAGIFLTKPFTDFTTEDFDALVSTNLLGFFYITQRTVKEMLKQKSGCVVSITAALADRPIAGENGSISMITKGGLNSATQNLAIEYAKDGIRFNAVAPGVVDTPMHRNDPNDSMLRPAMKKATVKDVVDAVPLPGTGRSCERRDSPRGRCRSGSSLVGRNDLVLRLRQPSPVTGRRQGEFQPIGNRCCTSWRQSMFYEWERDSGHRICN
jgi:NAD(P)-dependent dehydrogenase (short-subunit alcohol dehydrogenase family)